MGKGKPGRVNFIKNIAIAGMLVLCIAQTVYLWFGGFSNHDFLGSLFASGAGGSASEALGSLVRPFRIVVQQEDGFALLYGDGEREALRAQGDGILSQAMRSGEFSASYPLDAAALLMSGGVVYDYAVAIPSEAFGRFFQARTGLLTNRFRVFDRVALIPHDALEDVVRVVFVDDAARVCYEYTTQRARLGAELREAVAAQPAAATRYQNTALDESGRFTEDMFYAVWGDRGQAYNRLQTYSPYGEITIGNIERHALPFFEAPGGVMGDVDDSVFIYRDDNAIVKYHPNHMLEFSNYKLGPGSATNSFATAYAAAANLIQRDKGVVNEYYLAAYSQEGESWFFSFDYTVNGFPVFLSQNLSQSLAQSQTGGAEMTHTIEIEVQNDSVRKYRRYGLAFEVGPSARAVKQTGFWQTIENAMEGSLLVQEDAPLPVRDAVLGYRADGQGQLSLHWLIYDTNGMPLPAFD